MPRFYQRTSRLLVATVASGVAALSRFALLLSRFALAAWVGMGTFFVLAVINLRQSTLFDESTKLNHPRVLFPLFYGCEFTLLAVALAGGFVALRHPIAGRSAFRAHLGILSLVLALAIADYFAVYLPLDHMIGLSPLPTEFRAYHRASMWINGVSLALSMCAATLSLWSSETDQ